MNVKDLMKDAGSMTSYQFEQKLMRLIRTNYNYQNLDSKNRKIILGIVKKYKSYLRRGVGISSYTIKNEAYKLYQKRIKLDLSLEDLKDIKEILRELKR